MCFFGAVVLTIASVMSFNHAPSTVPVIPKPEFSIFIINATCALFAFLLVLFPTNWKLQAAILLIQSISTPLTGYEVLGTFLYAAFIILCFVNGFFKTHFYKKNIAFSLIWIFVLIGYGFYSFANCECYKRCFYSLTLEIAVSVFFFGFYYYVYKKLESLLVTLVPAKAGKKTNQNLPEAGTTLHLSDFDLTERQIKMIMEYLATQKSYPEMSRQFNTSVSTIKKDMRIIFECFNVSNLKELHILLLQYIVKP